MKENERKTPVMRTSLRNHGRKFAWSKEKKQFDWSTVLVKSWKAKKNNKCFFPVKVIGVDGWIEPGFPKRKSVSSNVWPPVRYHLLCFFTTTELRPSRFFLPGLRDSVFASRWFEVDLVLPIGTVCGLVRGTRTRVSLCLYLFGPFLERCT